MAKTRTIEEELRANYLRYLKLECNYSSNTLLAYGHDLDDYFLWLSGENLSPVEVQLADLERYAAYVRESGRGASSLARMLCGVRSLCRYMLLDGYIESDPSELLESPSLGMHLPEVLTTAEIDRMEHSIDLSRWEGRRNKAIIEMLFACGLRVSELVGLLLSDIYPMNHFVRVRGKGQKERLVPISESALRELRLWFIDRNIMKIKPGEEDYVFLNRRGAHLTRQMIFHIVKEVASQAGITKVVSPHSLRHSFATELLKGGADLKAIQAMLGHETIKTTEVYVHMDTTMLREEILLHHPRNIKNEENT